MATKTNDENNAVPDFGNKPKNSKTRLFIIIFAVLALVCAVGFGVLFYLSKKNASDGETEAVSLAAKKSIPVYLSLDNMVVNLADMGGEKVAQVGITLELVDAKASDNVKVYLPTIRSSILLLISQRESAELLSISGKEKLAADILVEALRPFTADSGPPNESSPTDKETKIKKKSAEKKVVEVGPVTGVHFFSFIVQ